MDLVDLLAYLNMCGAKYRKTRFAISTMYILPTITLYNDDNVLSYSSYKDSLNYTMYTLLMLKPTFFQIDKAIFNTRYIEDAR